MSSTIGPELSLIPLPAHLVHGIGFFRMNEQTGIVAVSALREEAALLAAQFSCATGFSNPVIDETQELSVNEIFLTLDADLSCLGDEGYRLIVTQETVQLMAYQKAGIFYGIQTLLQLLPIKIFSAEPICAREWLIPCVEINDIPRFAWRGAMLDVARHFLPLKSVLKFIDLLALHKMNILQLHLTDDQGWRIEIKKYPKLTEIGASRDKTLVGFAQHSPIDADFDPSIQLYDDQPYSGYYTQEQAREIVAYASARYITVVPEIEMPGHAQAAIAAYPFLGCTDSPVEVSSSWGIHDAVYKPSDQTFCFLENVLSEVMALFPSRYIHVGGDEAVKTQWKNSWECETIKASLELSDEAALQSYFIGRMDDFLTRHGRVLVGWDEILEGGRLSPQAVVMSWRGEEGGGVAAEQGHEVIMAPHSLTYFDYYQSEDRDAEPLAAPAVLTLPMVYDYEPVPANLSPKDAHHVLGAQGQLWSEYMPQVGHVEYMAFPRLSALAEVVWSRRESKNYQSFLRRLRQHLMRLDCMRVNYRPLGHAEFQTTGL